MGSSAMRSVLISAFLTFRPLIRSRMALHLEVLALGTAGGSRSWHEPHWIGARTRLGQGHGATSGV